MSFFEFSSRNGWEAFADVGTWMVIVGVAGEGIEIGIKLFERKYKWLEKWYDKHELAVDIFGAFFWFVVVLGLVIELKGNGEARIFADKENAVLVDKAEQARKESGQAIRDAALANEHTANLEKEGSTLNKEAANARLETARLQKQGEDIRSTNLLILAQVEGLHSNNLILEAQIEGLRATNLGLDKQVLVLRKQIEETTTNIVNLEPTNQPVSEISASVVLYAAWPTFRKLLFWRLSNSAEMTLCKGDPSISSLESLSIDNLTEGPLFPTKFKTAKRLHTYTMHFRSKGSISQAFRLLGPANFINDIKCLRIDAHFLPSGTIFVGGFATVIVNNSLNKRFVILPRFSMPNFPNAIIATNLDAFPQLKSQ